MQCCRSIPENRPDSPPRHEGSRTLSSPAFSSTEPVVCKSAQLDVVVVAIQAYSGEEGNRCV